MPRLLILYWMSFHLIIEYCIWEIRRHQLNSSPRHKLGNIPLYNTSSTSPKIPWTTKVLNLYSMSFHLIIEHCIWEIRRHQLSSSPRHKLGTIPLHKASSISPKRPWTTKVLILYWLFFHLIIECCIPDICHRKLNSSRRHVSGSIPLNIAFLTSPKWTQTTKILILYQLSIYLINVYWI